MRPRTMAVALTMAAFAGLPLTAASQAMSGKPAARAGAGMQMDATMQKQMVERMKLMQAQMDKLRQTTDPKEREKLLAEHMKSMHEGMQMMRGAGGGMMGMMGGGQAAGGQGMQMMEGRMDMMQMMMEQMMQHQQMMMQLPAK